jgi:hypothetical protein
MKSGHISSKHIVPIMKQANEAVQWGNKDKIVKTFTEVALVRLKINI